MLVYRGAGVAEYEFSGLSAPKHDKDFYSLRYATFVVPLVKAVQELSAQNDVLLNENKALRKEVDDITSMVTSLQASIDALQKNQ